MLRKVAFAASTFALLFLSLLVSAREARADAIAITSGTYRVSSPFRQPPRYISFGYDLHGSNFRASGSQGGHIENPSQPVGLNCVFPCLQAGSTFSLSPTNSLFTLSPVSSLIVDGQRHHGWFFGTALHFNTGDFTIPLDAGLELTLTASFTMDGHVGFQGYDLQNAVFTGYTFSSDIIGSGSVEVFLAYSQLFKTYEVLSVTYTFQPTAVPEPATMILLGTGLAAVAARRRSQRRKSRGGAADFSGGPPSN